MGRVFDESRAFDGDVIGVLGGMGPLASAAFVRAIYNRNRGRVEQQAPSVMLYSNPGVADRTATFLGGGDHSGLLADLEAGVRMLLCLGATRVVMCCVTSHYLLPEMSPELRERVVSLIDVALAEVAAEEGSCLLACTTGTRRLGLFQRHPAWEAVSHKIRLPTEGEQASIHDAIYTLKRTHSDAALVEALRAAAAAHGVGAVIAGCTELHLLRPEHAGANSFNQSVRLIDPLAAIADAIMEETDAPAIRA